ncbi:BnaC09g52020D [Brassica napus]|uniref:(rape) hypothetical protein n=1 Tax=Brassica napus TaxID=3708 RepID=A0A078IID9_BRANA|nr:unnamed protein product [Brassica napus]CDY49139.1 BnaC09g52020D [Brassica napus]
MSAQSPSPKADLAITQQVPGTQSGEPVIIAAKASEVADPETLAPKSSLVAVTITETNASKSTLAADAWTSLVKGTSKLLQKKGEAFTLPSGEACVKIPNQVIEKNHKSWDCFILGQFYSDLPPQGLVHSAANGIWSRHHRDITVTKMEGFSFLFRIPNAATRNRAIHQSLWQIEGQTMFVAKWEPGIVPVKHELTFAPIWLGLRIVPLQFFNEDSLERIAVLVGDPKVLHPATINKTNLEVAKVLTLIDPRKPLPEAVNMQFDSGEIKRIIVSSPWMSPVCDHCKEIGHSIKRCRSAPKNCNTCNSSVHCSADCPRKPNFAHSNKKQYKVKEKVILAVPKEPTTKVSNSFTTHEVFEIGSTSNLAAKQNITPKAIPEQNDDGSQQTEVEHDASYISSSEDTSDPNLQNILKKMLFYFSGIIF